VAVRLTGGEAHDRFEACLAEVRALEQARRPHDEARWAIRYRAASAARDAELAAYWPRQVDLATLNTALAVAVMVAASIPSAPTAALIAASLLGLGISVGWLVTAWNGASRLAHWEAQLDALDSDPDAAAAPTVTLGGAATDRSRPAPARGAMVLSVVFVVFWIAAAAAGVLVPGAVRQTAADVLPTPPATTTTR
jgi:hypothetical protein